MYWICKKMLCTKKTAKGMNYFLFVIQSFLFYFLNMIENVNDVGKYSGNFC